MDKEHIKWPLCCLELEVSHKGDSPSNENHPNEEKPFSNPGSSSGKSKSCVCTHHKGILRLAV